ncbi:PREDICTED: protein EMBRYONIC FLOWER 1-like isoform X1 [Nicotiana attenuata]|uniref:Protein embryonic flower 1 n=1 Tax=Nicotiana attenuata TaxID=49451 RepID=A0A314KLS2_NICAT|nr:PREDICTED: protein EMBRYONIC FLOWER 1-like isoform X1 [Nicotiana attenuata]OIT30217.1 protein embryonic flower 1 [Nicotiana attenuata]
MEKSIIAVKGTSQASDINTSVSKSSGSVIQIESISIDLDIPMPKKEEGNCQHFSIRGYVAEMRKRDRKICSPFASSSDCSTTSEEQLPPLDVPKFRWWRCKNCIHEIGTESAGEDSEILSSSSRSRLISANMASTSAMANVLPETKHELTSRKSDRNKAIIDDSPNTSGGYDFLCKPNTGIRRTVVEDKAIAAGNRTGSGKVRNVTGYPTIEVAISKEHSSQEIDTKSPAANLSNNSIRVAISDSTLSAGKIVSHRNLHISADDVSADISPEKEMDSPNDGLSKASMAFKGYDVPGSNGKALETSKTKLSRLPSLELRDYDETSSRSDIILAEKRQCDLYNHIPNDLPRRKTRKVRLLTDILGGQVNLETRHAKAERTPSSTTPSVPSELDTVGAPKDKGSFQKKRKLSQEDDSNLSEMSIQCNVAKRVRSFHEIDDSRSYEKESDGEGIPSGTKNLRIKHRNGINKKKNKQLRPVDGYSPEMPWQDTTMEDCGSKGYGAVNSFVHSAQRDGKFEPHLRSSYQSLVGTDRDSDLCWNSNKFPEVGRVPSTLMHPDNNFPGESSTRRKNLMPVTTDMEMVTSQPTHELSDKVRLDLSLNSFNHAENDITQSRNMTNWPFILQKGNKSSDPRGKDNTLVEQSNVPKSGQSSRKGVIYDLNQGISQTSSMWQEIQNSPILLQKGNLHVPDIMEIPHRHNKENLNEFLERSDVIKHQRNQHSEKALERGLSDDIPMEIVELMAKNQYERGLTETKTKCIIERTDGIARPHTEIHESEAMTWSRPGVISFHPANAKTNTDVGASRGSTLQFSHVKRNHLGMAQVERLPVKLFGTFPQTQQELSSGGQGSDMPAMHIRSGFQRGEEANPLWFSTVQNTPLGHGIAQKSIGQPNDKMIQKGRTISDIKSGDVRMQNEPHLLLPKSGGNADLNVKSMASLDPYNNEAIPAMQLLSLMDRRMPPSTPPFNLDANKLREKPFSPCSYHPRFHMDGKQSILNGSYLSHHQLKDSTGVYAGGYYADQISFKSPGQEKSRKSHAPSRCGGSKSERFVSSNGLLSMTQHSYPEKDEQNRILGTSSSRVLPLQDHNASKLFDLEGKSNARAILPVNGSNICSLNRNPAEFSVPEEGNPFTRSVKDPRIGKKRKQRRITKEKEGRLPSLGRAL